MALTMFPLGYLLLVFVASVFLWSIARYFKDDKQLRRFPSPSIAAFTPLWGMWYSLKGVQTLKILKVHERLGSVVRIAPNHISFTDPAAYKDIYGHGAPLIKGDFYSHVAGGNPSMAQATDKALHASRRRILAHIFSAKEITAMEPRIMATTNNLCTALKTKIVGEKVGPEDQYLTVSSTGDSGIFDIRPWLNMFTYDVISNIGFTNEYGFLKKGNDLCSSIDAMGRETQVHAMDTFHSANWYNTVTGQLPLPFYTLCRKLLFWVHSNKAGANFTGMSRSQVQYRLNNEPAQPDFFSFFPIRPTEKRPNPMTHAEVIAECATMLDAGNDTTQSTLTSIIDHLAAHPDKQKKLFDALTTALNITDSSETENKEFYIPHSKDVQNVGYLRAVLEENWRCRPPLSRGLPRRTIGEGTVIAGHFIPPGVTVSATVYGIHHDEKLFRRPFEFIPERWLPEEEFGKDEQEAKNLKEYCIPFSLGPRACIGRNLSYMEVSIAVAALVLNFEWERADKNVDLPIFERFNYNPLQLMVKGKLRRKSHAN